MNALEFERRLRALAKREGMTLSTFATLAEADRAVLLATIVRRFAPGAVYRERDVNAILTAWLATAGSMVETDHVNIRRWLVDTSVIARTPDCAEYRLHPAFAERANIVDDPGIDALDVDALVAAARQSIRDTRAQRKAAWLARTQKADAGGAPGEHGGKTA